MARTINKCIRESALLSKRGAGMCPHALARPPLMLIDASSRWAMFLFFFFFILESGLCSRKTPQPERAVQGERTPPEGFFPNFLLWMCRSPCLCHPASLPWGIYIPLATEGQGALLHLWFSARVVCSEEHQIQGSLTSQVQEFGKQSPARQSTALMHLVSPGPRSRCLRADAMLNFGEYFQCFDLFF